MTVPFGQRLRELRHRHNLSLSQVAEQIGVSKSSYAGYEKNYRHPPLDKLLLLSEFFRVSVDYILCKTDDPAKSAHTNNAKQFLQNKDLHWDGVPLSDDDLQLIYDLLSRSLSRRVTEPNLEQTGHMEPTSP